MHAVNSSIDHTTDDGHTIRDNLTPPLAKQDLRIILKNYVGDAFLTGVRVGEENSGPFCSGFITGRGKKYKDIENFLARDLGHLTSIISSIAMIYLFDKPNVNPLITTYLLTTVLIGPISSHTAISISSLFTTSTAPIIKVITLTAYLVAVVKLIDGNIGEEIGNIPKIKRILGVSCGTLNATLATISWGAGTLSKKFTDFSMAHMR